MRRPINQPYKQCFLNNCDNTHEAKGYCNKHYIRFRKYGDPESLNHHKTHGLTDSPAYKSWEAMKRRCLNKNTPAYAQYGGRGITICKKWLDFEGFLEDIGQRPEGMTLDRINNEEGYSPQNCRWASLETQARNKRIRRNNTSGTNGVYRRKDNLKYVAAIRADSRQIYLGQFNKLEQAIKARKLAEKRYNYV